MDCKFPTGWNPDAYAQVRACGDHWHVVRGGHDLALQGDPFQSIEEAVAAIDRLTADELEAYETSEWLRLRAKYGKVPRVVALLDKTGHVSMYGDQVVEVVVVDESVPKGNHEYKSHIVGRPLTWRLSGGYFQQNPLPDPEFVDQIFTIARES